MPNPPRGEQGQFSEYTEEDHGGIVSKVPFELWKEFQLDDE